MKNEKTCAICGKKYEYCNNCPKYSSLPRWKFLFHDENCKLIYDAVNDYKAKVISADAAKAKLSKLNLDIGIVPAIRSTVNEIMQTGRVEAPKRERKEFNSFKKNK